MKLFKQSMAAAALLTAGMMSSAALAADKVGYANIQAIFQSIPQTQAVEPALREEFKDQMQQVAQLEKDITYYQEKAQRDEATMSEQEKKDLQAKLMELGRKYQEVAGPLKQGLQQRQQEERGKIFQQIADAINTYAEKQNYDAILNSTSLLYLKDKEQDISKEIIEILSKTK